MTATRLRSVPSLGIVISTFDRRDLLISVVEAVQELTSHQFELVVADDGSGDDTVEWCRSHDVPVVTGPNRGVAWNKNRGLFPISLLECDPIVLMEDDVYPTALGWEQEWIEATRRWHHLGFMHPKISGQTIGGRGTAEDPYTNPKATAQALSVSAEVLAKVGFFDSRFRGWGHEHAEWTTRIKRQGYGFRDLALPTGERVQALYYIDGNLRADDGRSYRDKLQVKANRDVFERIKGDPPFRYPWVDEQERGAFLAEQQAAGIGDRLRASSFSDERAE
jgi:glycosyltransferase involved in cell wall biosynthesis